ncbi:MAG: hypothetical protein JXR33_07495 [Coriobacteriia bacterium]|nr:hypothetical protein [Coriobacteriia bacterium]
MTSTGVVSVGLGEDANGKPAIIVGMSTTREGLASLPDSLEGVPVVIRQVGTIGAQNNDE